MRGAKVGVASKRSEYSMHMLLRSAITVLVLGGSAASAEAQTVHQVQLTANPDDDEFRFKPAAVTARPGDVVLFRVVNGAPHSIVFEARGMPAGGQAGLNSAMPRRAGDLSSPLLTENGTEYRIALPRNLPAGTYRFFCLPHRAYDERGELRVEGVSGRQ